ncbi:hypothetical protein BH23ACT4_BH23ACT4_09540 [soil metagenome]
MTGEPVRLFVSGEVMTGRGIDQTWRLPVSRRCTSRGLSPLSRYVEYVWGDALAVLRESGVDARIINLETSVTDRRGFPWPAEVFPLGS